MAGRAQHKRLITRVYRYLEERGPLTAMEIHQWYNHDRPNISKHTVTHKHNTTMQTLSNVLAKGVLFEEAGLVTTTNTGTASFEKINGKWFRPNYGNGQRYIGRKVWRVRSLEDAVERCIAARRTNPIALRKLPKFLRDAVIEKMEEE